MNYQAVTAAFDYLSTVTDIPNDVWVSAAVTGVFAGKHDGPGPHDNGSPQQVHAGGDEGRTTAARTWVNGLSPKEKDAIHHWGADGGDIRAYQRGETSDSQTEAYAKAWNDALNKGVAYDGTIYRGLASVGPDGVRSFLLSDNIELQNDQSATSKIDYATHWSGSWYDAQVIWKVDQRSGVDLFDQTKVTYGNKLISEAEVVMRKGTTYNITGWDYIRDDTGEPLDFKWWLEGSGYTKDDVANFSNKDLPHTQFKGYYILYMQEQK